MYIDAIRLERGRMQHPGAYPFAIPAIRSLDTLTLDHPVTFFMGENGSGKSTLLEAIAVACGMNPEGGGRNFSFSTFDSHSELGGALRLIRGARRPRDTYFLRAESFYNVASYIEELDREPAYAPPLKDSYGGSLHERSHGESFFALMLHRLNGDGLYLFDEPEAALSPQRQLAFLCRMHELVGRRSQLLIATHSPILSAYPDSAIFQFSDQGIEEVRYQDTDSYQLTRRFVNDYPGFVRRLLEEQ